MSAHQQDRFGRRDLLKLTAVGACAVGARRLGAAEAVAVAAEPAPEAAAKKIPIALQLYSVRMECKKDKGKNFPKVIEAVAKMGYEGVEFAGYYNYKPEELRKMLDDNGLKCAGSHVGLGTLLGDNLGKSIDFHKVVGNRFLIVPGLPRKYRASAKAWKEAAGLFNDIAAKLKPHGMRTGYHNHSAEFKAVDGQVPWDLFFSNTVKDVVMQLDVGNCMHGGGDPVAYLKKYPGRATTMHMKEFGAKACLGEGKAPWKQIVRLCQTTAGTQWYIIEQEQYPYPPMETVRRCLAGLKKILAEA